LSGAVFLFSNKKITFIFSGNSGKGKETMAMYFLINYVIEKYSNTQFVLDFEGGNISGLSYFYAGFGSENVPYTSYLKNNLPWFVNWLKKKK
jgi:hypothetical protein